MDDQEQQNCVQPELDETSNESQDHGTKEDETAASISTPAMLEGETRKTSVSPRKLAANRAHSHFPNLLPSGSAEGRLALRGCLRPHTRTTASGDPGCQYSSLALLICRKRCARVLRRGPDVGRRFPGA
jgi:hypothetical protein